MPFCACLSFVCRLCLLGMGVAILCSLSFVCGLWLLGMRLRLRLVGV